MANFSVSNFTSLAGITTYGTRAWSVGNNNIFTPNGSNSGVVVYNTLPSLNGTLSATYYSMEGTNEGEYNGIVLRYIDQSNFIEFSINPRIPGNYDAQGLAVRRNTFNCNSTVDVPLRNIYGGLVSNETYPYITNIPLDGKFVINVHDNHIYDVKLYDSVGTYLCSGSYTDTAANRDTNGAVGFYHCNGWNSGFTSNGGWNSLAWVEEGPIYSLPSITSYTATPPLISQGDSSTICWSVTNGSDPSTTVMFNGVSVALTACSAVSPLLNTTFPLTATNSIGSVFSNITLEVNQHIPVIQNLSADSSEIGFGGSTTLRWRTEYANAWYMDNDIGWMYPATSGVETSSVDVTPSVTTTYSLSAYGPGITTPAVSAISVTVDQLPVINRFIPDSTTCSGSPFTLDWSFNSWVTSAYIDNGVGWVAASAIPNGGATLSAQTTTLYSLSAYNNVGQLATSTALQRMFIYPPTVYLSAFDDGTYIPDGGSVNVDVITGIPIVLDSTRSYDLDGQDITFYYYDNGVLKASGVGLSSYTVTTTIGTHDYLVRGVDPCGNDISATTTVIANSHILPIGFISNSDVSISDPVTITIDGTESYSPLSGSGVTIVGYQWFTGTNLDVIVVGATASTYTKTFDSVGQHKYRLRVVDSQGVIGWSDTFTVSYYQKQDTDLIAEAGTYGPYCTTGTLSTITFDASNSEGDIVSYSWNLNDIGHGIQTGKTVTVTNVSAGEYTIYLQVTDSNGVTSIDFADLKIYTQPTATAVYVYNGNEYTSSTIEIDCPNKSAHILLSADCTNLDDSLVSYRWIRTTPSSHVVTLGNTKTLAIDATPQHRMGHIYNSTYYCYVSLNALTTCVGGSNGLHPLLSPKIDDLVINKFVVDPQSVDYDSLLTPADPIEVKWKVSGAEHVYITINGLVDEVAVEDTTFAYVFASQNITISAVSGNCSKNLSIPVTVNNGLSACKLKEDYISLYAPEIVRYGADRLINLTNFNNDVFMDRDINSVIQLFENYLNTMFEGDNGVSLYKIPISTSATESRTDYLHGNFFNYEVSDE